MKQSNESNWYYETVRIPVRVSANCRNFKKKESVFDMIKYPLVKLVALILIIALNWAGLSAVIQTIANFNDTENSPQNVFIASTLDFSLDSPPDFSPVIMPDVTASRNINLSNDGILGFDYQTESSNEAGFLCDHLNLEAKLNGTTTYNGALVGFQYNAGEFGTTTRDWQFIATLTSDNPVLQNQTCVFDFVFDGTQIGGAGFYDQEIIQNTITSGIWQKVVINKVYYDIDNEHGNENENEWIELYNNTEESIDLTNWKICDNNSCDTLPDSNIIPAGGFVVIANKDTTWNYWEIPGGIAKINLDSAIGNGLSVTADMLILKNDSDVILDQMNWGTSTDTWVNWNEDVWVPGVTGVDEGHILARVPTGIDTDTAADWHDLGLPQVNVIWPNGGEVLWVGHYYDLQWTAINPNGSDTDLKIDIWYSKDSGNTWANIVRDTENDGVYNWRAGLCLDDGSGGCYFTPSSRARIKVMVWGPENFMVQNWDMSDSDFCPPIDYQLLTREELEMLKEMGLYMEEEIVIPEEEQPAETVSEEAATTTEEIAISTEEIATESEEAIIPVENDSSSNGNDSASNENQEDSIIVEVVNEVIEAVDETVEAVNETIDVVVEGVVEEIMAEQPANGPAEPVEAAADNTIVEDAILESAPVEVFDQTPATEQQAVIAPENNSCDSGPSDGGPGDSSSVSASAEGSDGNVAAAVEAAPADAAPAPAATDAAPAGE